MEKLIVACLVMACIFGCQSETTPDWPKRNLLEFGLPITIAAPPGAEVKNSDLGWQKDVSIKKGDEYFVQIFSKDASERDAKIIKTKQMDLVKANKYFTKVLKEEDNGFVYHSTVDSTDFYNFRYVKLQGDKEYIFQAGLIGKFTENQINHMYESVK